MEPVKWGISNGERCLIVRANWRPSFDEFIGSEVLERVTLFRANKPHASFLPLAKYRNSLKRLEVNASVLTADGIEELTELTELEMDEMPAALPFALEKLVNLEWLKLKWLEDYGESFWSRLPLRFIDILRFSAKDFNALGRAKKLLRIALEKSTLDSISGIENISDLRYLRIDSDNTLRDIDALKGNATLRSLQILHCPNVQNFAAALTIRSLMLIDLRLPTDRHIANAFPLEDLEGLYYATNLESCSVSIPVRRVHWNRLFTLPKLERIKLYEVSTRPTTTESVRAVASQLGREVMSHSITRLKGGAIEHELTLAVETTTREEMPHPLDGADRGRTNYWGFL